MTIDVTDPLLVGQVTDTSGNPVAVTASASGYASYTQDGIEVSSMGATPLPIRL
jgi:hypothetical protein